MQVIAQDLVELYAVRQQTEGFVYSPDTVWQKEFEEMFPFEETEDQLRAIEDTKKDMESTKVMDTLCACMGEGLLLYKVLQLKDQGKTLEEIAEWVEANKLHICHNVTVDDLNHLHRGGRISKTAAVFGTLVQVKPIIHMDENGKLQVIGKERGRKRSLNKIVDMAVEQSEGWENDMVMITHGDCIEDAEYVAERVKEKLGNPEVLINNIGTVIGSHTGPGVVAVFLMGNKR